MLKYEKTKVFVMVGIYGGCGLAILLAWIFGKTAEVIVALAFIGLALVEIFSMRARKATPKRRSVKGLVKSGNVEVDFLSQGSE